MASSTSNQKLFIGLLVGMLIGAIFALYGLELLPGGYQYAAAIMIGAFFVVAFLLFVSVYFRDRLFKAIFGEIEDLDSFRSDAQALTGTLAEAISDQLTKPLPAEHQHRARKVAPRLANFLIWSRIRNWWLNWLLTIFVAIGGLATTVLLVNQNKLLEAQNEKIEIQTSLMESERRGSQVVLMNSVLTDLSNEIAEQKRLGKNDSTGYSLSAPLIGRIAATSQGLMPYKFLQNGELTEREYSLERGQLLLALVNSRIDTSSLKTIFKASTFASVYLPNTDFLGQFLQEINLSGAYLLGSDFRNANFTQADLTGADLTSASFDTANLSEADLSVADLTIADLSEANLSNAKFHSAILNTTEFTRANLSGTSFWNANLTNAMINNVVGLPMWSLFEAKNLSDIHGLPTEVLEEFRKRRPCLFTESGCPLNLD